MSLELTSVAKISKNETRYIFMLRSMMSIERRILALRQNVARSLAYYERSQRQKTSDVQASVEVFLEEIQEFDVKITKTDISRSKNTIGASGAVSVAKLSILELFLKSNGSWRQYVQAGQSREEQYYSQVAAMISEGIPDKPEVIESFHTARRDVERGSEPEILGHYKVMRRSMHSLGDYNLSRIVFFRNEQDQEIYEFCEERTIAKRTGQTYTVKYKGFMNFVRNTYILHGHSFIDQSGQHEYTPFPEMMYIHNDRDVHRLVGIWTSTTRENSHPCASPIIMRKVTVEEFAGLDVGLLALDELDSHDRMTFDGAFSNDKGMLYIGGSGVNPGEEPDQFTKNTE